MARIQTPVNGISTSSSYTEGDCYSLVNLRPKNGALHPVPHRKVTSELSQKYDIIFVHQNSDYQNYIGIVHIPDMPDKVYWWNASKEPEEIEIDGIFTVNSVEQTGNVLCLITASGVKYLMYGNGNYNIMGEIPELQPVHFVIEELLDTVHVPYEDIPKPFFAGDEDNEENKAVRESVRSFFAGQFNKARKKLYDRIHGCFFDAHLMVYAFRLYDGTYVKQSSPVLLCPMSYPPQYFKMQVTGKPVPTNGSIDIYYGYYKVLLEFDTSYLDKWKDIITSVDIFVSPTLGYNAESNITDTFPKENQVWNVEPEFEPDKLWPLLKDQSKMIEAIKTAGNFYLIDSIPVGEKSAPPWFPFYFPKQPKVSSVDTDILTARESLPADNFSHAWVTGDVAFSYNRRLHLANIKTTLFNGFHFDFFRMLGVLQYHTNYYNGFKPSDYSAYRYSGGIMIAVDLKIDGNTMTVYSECSGDFTFWINPYFSYPDSRAFRARFYAMHGGQTFSLIHEIALTPSEFLNLSYCLNMEGGKVKPSVPNITGAGEITIPVHEADNTYAEQGKLKVSELDNPFLFPNKNTYMIGSGSILALATIAIRIPEGSFGQYPLYVFTTNGIYALSTGEGEVLYASQSTPTSYEIPVNNLVCQTPFGVAFVSARGICIIAGQQVELLTPQLQQPLANISIQSDSQLDGVLLNLQVNLTDFLKTIEHILYNPTENELVMHDQNSEVGLVYHFDSRQFYLSTENFDSVVQNTFPDLLVIEDKKIKDYSEAGSPQAHVSLVTRPLLFGTPDIKRLERMVLRANLFNIQNPAEGKKSFFLNYCSIDGVNFRILRGIGLNPSSRKDIDLGLFAKSKFRQFMIAFAGVVDGKSEIKFLETEIEKEYQNTKMR